MDDAHLSNLTEVQIDGALQRGRIFDASEPRAMKARYDQKRGMIIVDLSNQCSFAFPPHLCQGLESATTAQLANIEILGAGFGLHWEVLDVDITVQGLLAGIFGTRAHMARNAGRAISPAKAAAARANGAKGGRPRKVASA